MYIDVVNVTTDNNGNVIMITVTDYTTTMNVTPYQVFDALLTGRMESNTARLALYGLDIVMDGKILQLELTINKIDKQMLKLRLGMGGTVKKSGADKKAELEAEEETKRAQLREFHQSVLEKQRIENAEKAAKWKAMTPEQQAALKAKPKATLKH